MIGPTFVRATFAGVLLTFGSACQKTEAPPAPAPVPDATVEVKPAAKPEPAAKADAAPNDASAPCSVAGDWNGTGDDSNKTKWTVKMHVEQTGANLSGTLDWKGSNNSHGTESFRGTIDCGTRAFTATGQSVSPGATVIPGIYQGAFAPDLRAVDVIWKNGAPGNFHAVRAD